MNDLEASNLVETAARAAINGRCAPAFLHDVRGSMQALFSAVELLGRSARMGGSDAGRVDKVCDLAKRAIAHHEKLTMEILQLLTLQQASPAVFQATDIVREAVHFLRNDAAVRNVSVTISSLAELGISVERAAFHTMLVGLLTTLIDQTPPAGAVDILINRRADDVEIAITARGDVDLADSPTDSANSASLHELTFLFAHKFLSANGGRFSNDDSAGTTRTVRILYPCFMRAHSPLHAYPQ